jgi:tRNA modification GTPase
MGRAKSEPPVRASRAPASRHGDTIFALASGGGRSAIAVIRISGAKAIEAIETLSGDAVLEPRRLTLCNLHSKNKQIVLDHCLVATFPGPASFSGEDMAELHLHGGRAVLSAVVDELSVIPGMRPADAGEFTRRAFENGKLDLTAAEGIADLVNANAFAAAGAPAVEALGQVYEGWRERLVGSGSSTLSSSAVGWRRVGLSADNRRGGAGRCGHYQHTKLWKIKSFNYLAGRDAAIVSARAGTTRDVVEVRFDLGFVVDQPDTAGLEATDEIRRRASSGLSKPRPPT